MEEVISMRLKFHFIVFILMAAAFHSQIQFSTSEVEARIGNNIMRDIEKEFEDSSSYFISNMKQYNDDQVRFISSVGNAIFTPHAMFYGVKETNPVFKDNDDDILPHPVKERIPNYIHERGVVLQFKFVNSNEVEPIGQRRCDWNTNYFFGSDPEGWQTDVPNHFEILYLNIWDGIDLVYKFEGRHLKYDLIIHPKGDPADIQFEVLGIESCNINEEKDLVMRTGFGDVVDTGLFGYQGNGEIIDCEFDLRGNNNFGFSVSDYDNSDVLVIDPVLTYSTFLGKDGQETGHDIVVDSSGNAYIAGGTTGGAVTFPTTPGSYDTTHNGNLDAFVVKMNPQGTGLIFSTFLGGDGWDGAQSLCIDSNNYVYIAGYAEEGDVDFPTTSGGYDTIHDGQNDAFVTKLNPSGSSLVYSTFIGGGASDWCRDMCLDPSNNIILTGMAYNSTDPYPTTSGAYDTDHNGEADAFVTKLNSQGSDILFSTFLGGSEDDEGYGISLDASGDIFVTGRTDNSTVLFPTTDGAYQEAHMGSVDAFITKLSSTGSDIIYSTLIGGDGQDDCNDICIDPSGNAYITGATRISTLPFPTTSSAYQTLNNGDFDAFVTKIDPSGANIIFSTLIGGGYGDTGNSILLDSRGNVMVGGHTIENETVGFPTTPGSYDPIHNGIYDGYIVKLSPDGSDLLYSTFLGGDGMDFIISITIDAKGMLYATGNTENTDNEFPTTNGAHDRTIEGYTDVFVTKMIIISSLIEFEDNSYPEICTTGEYLNISIKLNGSVGDEKVFIEYWFGNGLKKNLSMDGPNPFTYYVDIPTDSIETIHYICHVQDSIGFWFTSPVYNRSVADNDNPIFGTDTSSATCSTGDTFTFTIQAADNIALSGVHVKYGFETGVSFNETMEGPLFFTYRTVIADNATGMMYYSFHAVDVAGNWINTPEVTRLIIDDDAPELLDDETPLVASTGDDIEIKLKIVDNIGIRSVDLTVWFGVDGVRDTIEMNMKDEFYVFPVSVPETSLDSLWYQVSIADLSGLFSNYTDRSVVILDDIPPSIEMVEDMTVYQGEEVNFAIKASDNINVTSYEWEGTPIIPDGDALNGIPTKSGIFEITVTAYDMAENHFSISFNLTVLSRDHDTDGDGIPDLVEIEYGLDMEDPLDADGDLDGDGLTNLEEFRNGTSLLSPDTDNDQMPDNWEIEHGLDPLVNVTTNDGDGDGKTDLEEYLEGSDPNVDESEQEGEEDIPLILIIIITLILMIVVLAGVGVFLVIKKKGSEPEEEHSDEDDERDLKTEEQMAYEDLYGSPEGKISQDPPQFEGQIDQ